MKVRNQELRALFTPEEVEQLKQRMAEAGVRNRSAFIRKMALDGYVVRVDMDGVLEVVKLLRSVSNNVNQIARRCNETRNLYAQDVEDLRKGYASVWTEIEKLMKKFEEL